MSTLAVFFIIVGLAAIIGVVAFILYRILNPKLKEEEKSEKEFVEEELQRVLKPVEDENTAKAINEYKDEEDQ